MPEDHPARTRRKHPGRGSPGRRHDQGATTTGNPAAIRTGGSQQDHADDGRQQGQEQRGEPGQGTGPRAKKRATRATAATPTTSTTRSPAAGSRPGTCRRITRPAPGGHRQRLRRSGTRPGTRRSSCRAPPGGQQARHQVEPPGPRITRPPCSLPTTSRTAPATMTTGSPAAIRTGGSRQKHTDDDRQQGQERRSEPGRGARPRAKKRTTRKGTAARATPTTRTTGSPAAGSRTGTPAGDPAPEPAPGGAAAGHDLADSRPGTKWNHPGRGSPGSPALCRPAARPGRPPTAPAGTTTPAAIRTGGSQQDHTDDGRQQGQEQRSEPDQGTGPRAKKETGRTATATPATRTTRSPGTGSRPGTCRRITRPAPGGPRQRLRRSGTRTGTRWSNPGRDRHDLADSRPGACLLPRTGSKSARVAIG